ARQPLGPGAAVDEHQALLAVVQARDDGGRVVEGAHVVDRDLRRGARPRGRGDDDAATGRARGEPGQQVVGVADGGRQADALERSAGEPFEPGEDREQVPAAVVAGEGVDLVDDDGTQV